MAETAKSIDTSYASPDKDLHIDFMETIKEAYHFVKKHAKTVLTLGLIISITGGYISSFSSGGSGGGNYSFPTSNNSSSNYDNSYDTNYNNNYYYTDTQADVNYKNSITSEMEEAFGIEQSKVDDFIGSSTAILAGGACCGLLLVWLIVGTYFNIVSNTALINFTYNADKNVVKTFKEVWHEGKKTFWTIFSMKLIYFLIFVLISILSIPLALCLCIGWILLIILEFFYEFILMLATRFVILDNMKAMDGLKKAYAIAKENYKTVIYFGLYNLLIRLAFLFLILIPVGIVIGIIVAVSIFASTASLSTTAIIILVILGLLLFFGVTIPISTLFNSFKSVYDTKVFAKVKEKLNC